MNMVAHANSLLGQVASAQAPTYKTCRNCTHCEALIYSDYRAKCLKSGEQYHTLDNAGCGEWQHYQERRYAG